MTDKDKPIDLRQRRLETMLSPKNRKIVRKMQPGFLRQVLTSQLVPGWLLNQKSEEKNEPAEVIHHPSSSVRYEYPSTSVYTLDGGELKWPDNDGDDDN